MPTYTVKAGDTLSAIAKQYGVKVSDITGYRSGNPNLIYPNEVLTIGVPTTTAVQPLSAAPAYKAPVISPTATVKPLAVAPEYKAPTTQPTPSVIAQTTTQPVITTSTTPKVGTSQIDAGKQAIAELTGMGVSTDIGTVRTNWTKFGLDTKLGSWIGSTVQWNAYSKYAQDELTRISAGIKEVQQKTTAIQQQVTAGGITPTTPPGETPIPEAKTTQPLDIQQTQLPDTDIGNIINDIGQGTLATPETVLGQAQAQLLTDAEKARATSALSTLQQQLAKRGMTFSGIRTVAEESAAAESLSNLSGINLDLAGKIISAAREEQTRREQVIKLQQTAQDTALRAMGYVIDPITGTLQRTLERERFEEPAAVQPKYFSSQGSYFGYDPSTGELIQIYQAPEQERNLSISYFTNDKGEVTKVVSDPLTGGELYRENLGVLGKPSSMFATAYAMGYDLNNPEDAQRFQEDFGLVQPSGQSAEDTSFWSDVSNFFQGTLNKILK